MLTWICGSTVSKEADDVPSLGRNDEEKKTNVVLFPLLKKKQMFQAPGLSARLGIIVTLCV